MSRSKTPPDPHAGTDPRVLALMRIAHMCVGDGGEPTWRDVALSQSRLAREALGLCGEEDADAGGE